MKKDKRHGGGDDENFDVEGNKNNTPSTAGDKRQRNSTRCSSIRSSTSSTKPPLPNLSSKGKQVSIKNSTHSTKVASITWSQPEICLFDPSPIGGILSNEGGTTFESKLPFPGLHTDRGFNLCEVPIPVQRQKKKTDTYRQIVYHYQKRLLFLRSERSTPEKPTASGIRVAEIPMGLLRMLKKQLDVSTGDMEEGGDEKSMWNHDRCVFRWLKEDENTKIRSRKKKEKFDTKAKKKEEKAKQKKEKEDKKDKKDKKSKKKSNSRSASKETLNSKETAEENLNEIEKIKLEIENTDAIQTYLDTTNNISAKKSFSLLKNLSTSTSKTGSGFSIGLWIDLKFLFKEERQDKKKTTTWTRNRVLVNSGSDNKKLKSTFGTYKILWKEGSVILNLEDSVTQKSFRYSVDLPVTSLTRKHKEMEQRQENGSGFEEDKPVDLETASDNFRTHYYAMDSSSKVFIMFILDANSKVCSSVVNHRVYNGAPCGWSFLPNEFGTMSDDDIKLNYTDFHDSDAVDSSELVCSSMVDEFAVFDRPLIHTEAISMYKSSLKDESVDLELDSV